MWANNKRLKKQVMDLRLPWWLKLVKSGIPYSIAAITAMVVMLTLGGWLPMPESIQLLKWVEALFMAMSPAVKFLAVTSIGLGTFLSTFEVFSVFVKGFLYHYAEKAASEGLEVLEQLAEQNKDLRDNLILQMKLNEQIKHQTELLKGYAKGLHFNLDKKALEEINEQAPPEFNHQYTHFSEMGELSAEEAPLEEANPDDQQELQEQDEAEAENAPPKQPEPVLFSTQNRKKRKERSSRHHTILSSHGKRRSLYRNENPTGHLQPNNRHQRKNITKGF